MENEKYIGEPIESDVFDHSDPETLQEHSDEKREGMAEDSVREKEND